MQIEVILLAGGASRRFARAAGPAGGQKLLALWQGRPLFHYALEAASDLPPGCRPWIVTGQQAIAREALRRGIRPIQAPPPEEGIAASVRAGVQAVGPGRALCFLVCDQPRFTPRLLRGFLEGFAASGLPLGRARAGERMGSPTAFAPQLRRELLALRGDQGGRALFHGRERETFYYQVPPECLEDLDLPWDT